MSDKKVDEINLKDLSKKIAQSSGNKNLHKAMKKSKDKTTSDLAAMRKRLDALKAGYAAESVELEEGVIDQVKDIVAKKQAKKISGVMVDMFTASAICQIYDKVNDANKAKMDKLPITKLADVAMKMMKRESVELDEMRQPYAVVDTADGNKVVGTASDEKGAKSIITTSQLPPMKIKDKKTLKIVKTRKKQNIGRPLKEEVELDEAKQVLAHGGKGQYKIVSDGGAISVMFKGKVVGKGDFDRGADSFFISMKGQKGQKSFDDAQDIADYFAKMKIKEEVQIDEVLDTPKAMQSYRDKAKYSADRAASSAAAKILRGKDKDGNRADHSAEVKTRDKRAKGLKMVDRNAARKTFNRLRNEMTEGGMKRIATTQSNKAERMASGGKKGLETFKKKPADSRMSTADRMQRLDKNLKKLKNMRKTDKSWGKSSEFDFVDEAAPKIDPAKFAAHMARHDKPKKMTSTQKSLADIRKKSESFEPHMMYDPKTGKGYKAEKEADHLRMKKMGYVHDKPEVNEKYKIMHKTMSAALQHAYDEAEKKGFEVDKDDIDNKVAMGPRKPSSGKTNSYNLGLSKNGKPVKKRLHIQVYNMDNKGYELNMYVS